MKNLFLTLIVSIMLFACGTQKNLPTKTIQETTKSNVEVRHNRVLIHDTTYIEIPAQTAERTTQDSTSHLENDFAVSDAKITRDGSLFHDLRTKPQKKPVTVDKEIERTDSIVYINKYIEVPIPVERQLTYWERISIRWFPHLVWVILVLLCYTFKKPLLAIIRRFI